MAPRFCMMITTICNPFVYELMFFYVSTKPLCVYLILVEWFLNNLIAFFENEVVFKKTCAYLFVDSILYVQIQKHVTFNLYQKFLELFLLGVMWKLEVLV